MVDKDFGWCFIGAGSITRRVMKDMAQTAGGTLATVWSRSGQTAAQLAAEYGAKACASVEEAVLDPRVQAVYVATPNGAHRAYTLAALALGKPVLCEKPFALDIREAQEMILFAKEKNLYLMEGMWTRFNPAIRQALSWIREGRIGAVRSLSATFCEKQLATDVRFNLAEGGGSLMDVGVYNLALSQFVFGQKPQRIEAMAEFAPSGVDGSCAITCQYQDGAIARLFSALSYRAPHEAVIYGEEGLIRLPRFWAPDQALLTTPEGLAKEEFATGKTGEGFNFEFDAVMEDIRAGRKENEWITHSYTLAVMALLDAVREKIGLRFPSD